MSLDLAKKPLEIKEGKYSIKAVCEKVETTIWQTWFKFIKQDAAIIVWRMQSILWGTVKNGKVVFYNNETVDPQTVLEMRIFNETEELYVVRDSDEFVGRYIEDDGPETIKYVDSIARLWGKRTERQNDFVVLKDVSRKLILQLPCSEDAEYYGLVTRNYIGYAEETGQAGYTDYRFVSITSAEGGK